MCIVVVRWKNFAQPVPLPLSQERKRFFGIFIAFSESAQNSVHFEEKDQLYRLNILEVSDPGKCGSWNAWKLLFQNTVRESTCSWILNTAHMTMAALFLELFTDPTHIELEKISVSKIWNLKTFR